MAEVNTVNVESATQNKPDIPANTIVKNENKPTPDINAIANTQNPPEPITNNIIEMNGVQNDQKDLKLNGETPTAIQAQNPVLAGKSNEEPKVVSDPNPIKPENPIEATAVKEISQPEGIVTTPPAPLANGADIVANSDAVGECPTGNGSLEQNDVKSEELDAPAPLMPKPIPVVSEDEWAKREKFLLEQIAILQKEQGDTSIKGYQLQLKVKTEENYILKAKIINLETELSAVLKKPNAKNKDIVEKIKKQHEELLTKARGMLFDKTKMIKNQELQIEALGTQVSSLKEVVTITKDLLKIRNMEVEHLQQRMECMDLKIKAERERHALMANKLDSGTKVNEELKKEYETQLALFKELKVKYEEKFQAMEKNQMPPSTSQQPSE